MMDPAKDRTFQAAVKAERVMTVFQETVGTKADRGEIGFQPGPRRQFLLFPKSLKPFAGFSVVGIKYDLIKAPEFKGGGGAKAYHAPKRAKPKPKAERMPKAEPEPELKARSEPGLLPEPKSKTKAAKPKPEPTAKAVKPKAERKTEPRRELTLMTKGGYANKARSSRKRSAKHNVVAFEPKAKEEAEESEEIAELKKQVRHAMAVLEEGKAVAAFNLLKRIVE